MNIKKYYKTYRVLPPDYFYIENAGDGENTLSFYTTGSGNLGSMNIEYSFDCINWTLLAFTLTETPIEIKHNEKIYFRSTANTWAEYAYSLYGKINTTNNIKVGGNILSLIWSDKFEDKTSLKRTYSFYSFFSAIGPKLLSAKNLKLYGTTEAGYKQMFSGCTSLVDAPIIMSTTVGKNLYQGMFSGCTSLTTAPALPATVMKANCYDSMFSGCTSLTTAPDLPATTLADYCYNGMFSGCTSLTTAPTTLPATTLFARCYQNMFYGCTSLTTAPDLPATALADYCYASMFRKCSSLTTAPALPATELAPGCYSYMLSECAISTAPTLPALYLFSGCYGHMFYRCSNLTYIKAYFLNAPASTFMGSWVDVVSRTGTFVKNPDATWEDTFGISAIPTGWTVVTE